MNPQNEDPPEVTPPKRDLWSHLEGEVCHECIKLNLALPSTMRGLCHRCAFASENQGPPPHVDKGLQ